MDQHQGEKHRHRDRGLDTPAADLDHGPLDPAVPTPRISQVAQGHASERPASGGQPGVETGANQQTRGDEEPTQLELHRPLDPVQGMHRDQILGRQHQIARDHHGPSGHQEPEHGLGAVALQRLIEQGTDGQSHWRQSAEARFAAHEHEHCGKGETEGREDKEIELAKRQAITIGLVAPAQADEWPAEREDGQGAPRVQAEAKLADEGVEGCAGSPTAGNPAKQQGVLTCHVGLGHREQENKHPGQRNDNQCHAALHPG